MTGPYPHPGFGPPARRSLGWLPGALIGVVALAGLLATLLPVWVVDVGEDYLLGPGEEGLGGTVVVALNFYSWVASAVPVFGLIPLALAAAVAVAATQLVRGVDRGLWGATAALMTITVVLAGTVALRPTPKTVITGELAREMTPDDLQRFGPDSMDVPVSYGAGLIIALGCVLVVLAIAAWQYLAAAPRRELVPWPQPAAWS
ncbi:hypothetical protein [Mycobacterium sp. 1274756.6]|uniref:hypothetical protein n=1 Tax=Mycobacterium sp. 1274756.6 TaxID=1834076 RepID=UPI0007FD2413|nr:hypothetical protein [Mycobacterium sp. 1274756.6]OBJ72510.1 hypothetical protein A5643_05285 [Mycobacterium sp. 1274756.6]